MSNFEAMSQTNNPPPPEPRSTRLITEGMELFVEEQAGDRLVIARSTGNAVEGKEQHSIGEFVHQYLRHYISFADQKAAFVFGTGATLLAFLMSKDALRLLHFDHGLFVFSWTGLFGLLAASILASSATVAIAVIAPRLGRGNTPSRGVIFWEDIATFWSATDYASALDTLQKKDAQDQIAIHCYVLAKICRSKYRTLKWAIWLGGAGFLLTVVFLFLL